LIYKKKYIEKDYKIYQLLGASAFLLTSYLLSNFILLDVNAQKSNAITIGPESNVSSLTSFISLPEGVVWNVNVNGTLGTLTIFSITNDGIVNGKMTLTGTGTHPIRGVYDKDDSKLTFMRIINLTHPTANQIFTGYLLGTHTNIAGFFEALPDAGGTANRTVFGWYGIG
jgi:hypothetical protein